MTNVVKIDIEVTQHAAQAQAAGRSVSRAMTDAATDIDRAFDKTAKQLSSTLDRIEKDAWQSGRGSGEAFDTAMSGLRNSLGLIREEAGQTGQGLRSSLGDSLAEVRRGAEKLADSMKPVAEAAPEINRAFDKTARLVAVELDRIERDAWEAGRGTDQAFQAALANVRGDFERIRDVGKRTGASLESDLGGSLREVKQEMTRLRDEAQQTGKKIEQDLGGAGDGVKEKLGDAFEGISDMVGDSMGSLGGMIQGGVGAASGGALAAGLAIGGFLMSGIEQHMQQTKIGGLIAAQTGATAGEAGRLGDIAGDVFSDNFGDSIEQVGEAMSSIFENKLISTDAPEAAIRRVTESVITLTQTTGESADAISRAAHQLLVTGLAGSLTEALNMIQRAQEAGLNASDDLMDTITEYSTNFRDLGLSGRDAFGLLSQAIQGGSRDTDYAADALKEFAILAQDSASTASRGFQTLGMDAKKSMEDVARGGDPARQVLSEVLNRLQAMPESVARSSTAVDLFGTKAEDLGDALYDMDLDTAVDQFGKLEGAVDNAEGVIASTTPSLESFGRTIKTWAAEVIEAAGEVKTVLEGTGEIVEGKITGEEADAEATGEAADAQDKKTGAIQASNEATSEYVATIDTLIAKQLELQGKTLDVSDATIRYQEDVAQAQEAVEKFAGQGLTPAKDAFDLSTEAGREMQGSLNDLAASTYTTIEAMRANNATNEEVQEVLRRSKEEFINVAIAMGMDAAAAQVLADKLYGIPDQVVPVVGLQDNASPGLQAVINRINSIPEYKKTDYFLYTYEIRGSSTARDRSGSYGGYGGQAHGGLTPFWGAQSGGMRHASTFVDEAGPELIELPSGSRVMTAGATRAMAESGALGGGGGGPIEVTLSWAGTSDPIVRGILEGLRAEAKWRYGGNAQAMIGQGGAA